MLTGKLSTIDLLIVIAYFLGTIFIGIYLSRHNKDAKSYFLADRDVTWPLVGLALFASNISSTTLVGLAGDAYSTGISVYNYEWLAAVVLVFFAVFMLPQVLRSQVYTMPEYLERRYDRRSRLIFSGMTLFLNVVVDASTGLFAGALLFDVLFPGTPVWLTCVALALATGVYTIFGGLRAVIVTEVFQAVLLLFGSALVTFFVYLRLENGWETITQSVPYDKLSLIRPLSDPAFPWLGLLIGAPLLGFYFWCTNQFMAQRFLAAKSVDHARWGALFAGLLKLPTLAIMVLPGTAAIIVFPDLPRADLVFPTLLVELLPVGVLGLVLAGVLAALMSSIASTLNSASTLVTMDFVRVFRPGLSGRALMRIGRIATFVFMTLAVLWAPQIANFDSLFKYLQQVLSYTVGPIVALFIVGSFWRRANGPGAFWALMTGFASSVGLFVVIVGTGAVKLHFLYVAPILAVITTIALVVVSLMTPAPTLAQVEPLLWRREARRADEPQGLADYRWQAIALLALTAAIVWYFR
ncbi:MAG TPA: sodium transporter [Hyphomonadaceae bacterium]|nr:sodium transporter [Hyphomonadaceae bacterium]